MHSTRRQHSSHQHGSQNGASLSVRHSPITSGGINDHYPSTTYNRETQRAILSALTKLQRDLHNISERLNRLETTANLLQQVRSFFLSFSYSTRKSFLETIIFLSRTAGKCSRPHRPINDRVYFFSFLTNGIHYLDFVEELLHLFYSGLFLPTYLFDYTSVRSLLYGTISP